MTKTKEPDHNIEIITPEKRVATYYQSFEGQLQELEKENASLVFDIETTAGEKEARSHVYKLRQSKTAIETARKDEKAQSLEYGRLVDGGAKALSARVEAMIDHHMAPLDAKAEAEENRVKAIQSRIESIQALGILTNDMGMTLDIAELEASMDQLANIAIDDTFEEFIELAATAKDTAIEQLNQAIPKARQAEADRAELERLRSEKEESDKAANEERVRQQERDRIEAQAKAKESAETAENQRRASDKEHRGTVNSAAAAAIKAEGSITEGQARDIIVAIVKGIVPNVTLKY